MGDAGKEYRNVIGLPGGMGNKELWPLFEAANTHRMPLLQGTGGNKDDTEDEYVVYVYDSNSFPFFRGEASHQFHTNDVIKREVPSSYTGDLKQKQKEIGRLDDDHGCVEIFAEIALLFVGLFATLVGIGTALFFGFLPSRLRCWEQLGMARVRVTNERHGINYEDGRQPAP